MTGTESTSGNLPVKPLFSPEFSLLLLCAHAELNASQQQSLSALLEQNPDWDLVWRLSRHHGMLPRLHLHLAGNLRVPEKIRAELAAAARRTAVQTGYLAVELSKIHAVLQAKGIRALAYKGPALGALLYGERALREFSDIDLLIRPESSDIEAACAALQSAGFAPEYEFRSHLRRAYLRTGMVYEFWSANRNYHLELHWKPREHPSFASGFDPEWLWNETQHVTLGGREIETLSNVNALLLLAMHAAKHGWEQLSWLIDMAELGSRFSAKDWETLEQRALAAKSTRLLTVSLLLCNQLLETKLPVQTGRKATALAANLADHLANGRSCSGAWLQLRLREGVPAKIRLLRYLLITPGKLDYLQFPLPRAVVFLYPAVRAYRLCRDHGGAHRKLPQHSANL